MGLIKIDIEHFDLEFERNIQTTEAFIELHDTYFRYVSKHDSEIPKDQNDLLQGWIEKYYNWDLCVKREAIISLEKYWNDITDKWQLELEAFGYPNTIKIFYKDANKMEDTFSKLFSWVFKTSQTEKQ